MAKKSGSARRGSSRGPGRVLLGAVALAVAVASGGAAEVRAASPGYYVLGCAAASRYDFSTAAFAGARSSRRMVVGRGCHPQGPGLRGLITRNVVRRGKVARGEYASVELASPPGARLDHVYWAGELRRADCGYSVEVFGLRPRAARLYIGHLPAFRRCPRRRGARASGWPRPRLFSLGNATRLVQRVVCRRRSGCSSAGTNMVRTFSAKVHVSDPVAPKLRIVGGGLASGRWVNGARLVRYVASDNVGIARERLTLGDRDLTSRARACNPTRVIPCPGGGGQLLIDTARLPNGPQELTTVVEDSAGNPAQARTTALVDNSPPGEVGISLSGGEGWRQANGFSVSWANPEEEHAPIAAARYRLCSSDGSGCVEQRQAGAGIAELRSIAVPEPGDWTLRLWREDEAGNADAGNASLPVHLRYDPDAPKLHFEPLAMSDPTMVTVPVEDPVSGAAGGEIELQRRGTSVWHALATRLDSGRLVARIDDSKLPPGTYELRARAFDQAGNESSTRLRADGEPMVVTLPLRFPSVLSGEIIGSRTVWRVVRSHGRRRRVRREVRVTGSRVRLALFRSARIAGRLTNEDGEPIPDAQVYVFSRSEGRAEALAGAVKTGGRGRYGYALRATRSRSLRLVYEGTNLVLPSERRLTLLVPAASTIGVNRRSVRNGHSVVFSGRVRSLPVPSGGKLVEVQAHFRGRWRTFSTVRSDSRGGWRFRYRFGGTRGRVVYRFRVWLPKESGYPFEAGSSRAVRVTVRGR